MDRQQLSNILKEKITGQVLLDEPLSRHTSMDVGGPAAALIYPRSITELSAVISVLNKEGMPFFPVGNGTNLIVRDGGYDGVIICLKNLQNCKKEEPQNGLTLLHVQAGLSLQALVSVSIREALAGIEFYAGIPGSVGGAVKMNAGAFGRSTGDVITEAMLLDNEGQITLRSRDTLKFTYRSLILPEGFTILEVSYRLHEEERGKIEARVKEIFAWRNSHHPLEYPNAGSIFKNPKEIPAGQLIEEAGLKGFRLGDARISEKHGNFIENVGRAKASDILALMELTMKKVHEKSGILLEPEVQIIGD